MVHRYMSEVPVLAVRLRLWAGDKVASINGEVRVSGGKRCQRGKGAAGNPAGLLPSLLTPGLDSAISHDEASAPGPVTWPWASYSILSGLQF